MRLNLGADIRALRLERQGRGRALHQTWTASTARVVAYMDVDLSTDLNALLPLVAPLMSEQLSPELSHSCHWWDRDATVGE